MKKYTGELIFAEFAHRSDCSDATRITWGVIPHKCFPDADDSMSYKLSCSSTTVFESVYSDTTCGTLKDSEEFAQGKCHAVTEEEAANAVDDECDESGSDVDFGYNKWTCKDNTRGVITDGCDTGSDGNLQLLYPINKCITPENFEFAFKFYVSGSDVSMHVWEGQSCSGSSDGSATFESGVCKDGTKHTIYKGQAIEIEWKGTKDCSDTVPFMAMFIPGRCFKDDCSLTSAKMRCSSDLKKITRVAYDDDSCNIENKKKTHDNGVCFDEHFDEPYFPNNETVINFDPKDPKAAKTRENPKNFSGVSSAVAIKPLLATAILLAVPLLF
eukprot:g6124.t1